MSESLWRDEKTFRNENQESPRRQFVRSGYCPLFGDLCRFERLWQTTLRRLSSTRAAMCDRTIGMRRRAWASLQILLLVITGSAFAETSDIGKGEHPPDVTRTFSGIVERIDAKTLSVSRPNEKHTFLLGDCSEAPRVKVPVSALHRPVGVTYVGDIEPYCAVKVEVLSALPKPTPKQEDTPTHYMTGSVRALNGEHLKVRGNGREHEFVIDVLTVYYDRQGYVILDPKPKRDLTNGSRIKLGFTGKREPFRAVSVEILK